jgi:hypothetical protein
MKFNSKLLKRWKILLQCIVSLYIPWCFRIYRKKTQNFFLIIIFFPTSYMSFTYAQILCTVQILLAGFVTWNAPNLKQVRGKVRVKL